MPAAEYSFTFDTATDRMSITNRTTNGTGFVLTRQIIDLSTPTENTLVFQRDGQQVVLDRVWSEQAGHVHDIVHGTEVRELE